MTGTNKCSVANLERILQRPELSRDIQWEIGVAKNLIAGNFKDWAAISVEIITKQDGGSKK